MKLDEREISEEIPHVVSRNKDRKSLLYQAEFLAEKKRENFLRNKVSASRNMNKFEHQRKRENFLRNGEDQLKNDLVIMKYDQDLKRLYENAEKEMNAAEQGRRVERKREEMRFPKISQQLQSDKTGSAVIKFSDKNVKIDIYLPNLT
jgi:hypothetical protein